MDGGFLRNPRAPVLSRFAGQRLRMLASKENHEDLQTLGGLREPALASLTPRAREWEMTRYRAYQAQLAGQPIGETFSQANAFLNLAADGSSLSRT